MLPGRLYTCSRRLAHAPGMWWAGVRLWLCFCESTFRIAYLKACILEASTESWSVAVRRNPVCPSDRKSEVSRQYGPTDKITLVTGAGSGMGMETALHLAALGHRVYGSVCTETEQMSLAAAARARNVTLEILRFDVTREDQVRPAIDSMLAATGRIDALVQFVGIGLRGFFEDLDISEIERVFQVNLFGLMRVTQAVLPHMRKAMGGRIILTSSVGGRMASMGIGGYASSKFAIEGWAESLHQEMAPFNVRVSLLEPGLIHTPHFGIHRNVSRRAADPASPYYTWFRRHESLVDGLLAKSSFTTADVAAEVRTHSGLAAPSSALCRRNES